MSHRKRNKKFKKGLGKWSTFFHKWLGLAIGIQVVLWILSGLIFTIWDIEVIRSEHTIAAQEPFIIDPSSPTLPPQSILLTAGKEAHSIQLRGFMGNPVYEVDFGEDNPSLYDARSGELLSPLGSEKAAEIANLGFNREAQPSEPVWMTEYNMEYRTDFPLPVWKVDMNDEENMRLYVSPYTGEVFRRRSDRWRIFDFFWMLHIMDYEDRTDFNHPLLIFASVFALIFSITGIVMLFFRFKKKDFGLGGNGRKK